MRLGFRTAISGAASGIEITGATATGDFDFAETSVSSSGTALNVSTNNAAAAATFASLTATAGAGTGILASNGGIVNTVTATGGPTVDVTSTSLGSGWTFATVGSSDSPGDGVNLASVTGNFIANGGTIAGAAGIAFDLEGGNSTVTYAGIITNGTGQSVEVTARTGGTTTFSGSITDSNDSGGGINLASNTGGATNFTGQLTLDTGASAAFSASGNIASSVTATNAANTLVTTTATALNVANTTIGSDGLVFRSINSNGVPSGIVLNTTGSTAGLTVTGTGSAGSGGTIQNSTSTGISLTSTSNVSLRWMNVTNAGDDGIRGQGVNTFSLLNSTLTTNGNATQENGLQFGEATGTLTGITGTLTLTNTSITGSAGNNVHIRNTSGTLAAMNITGGSFNNINDVTGVNSFLFEMSGTAITNAATISGATFSNNSPQRALEVQAHDIATITNNNVNNGRPTPLAAISVEADNQSGSFASAPTVRADIHGNTVPASGCSDFHTACLLFYEYDGDGISGNSSSDGIGQLVDNPLGPGGQTAAQQLDSANTGSTFANSEVAIISGPINVPPP